MDIQESRRIIILRPTTIYIYNVKVARVHNFKDVIS